MNNNKSHSNDIGLKYFDALYKDRLENDKLLNKPSMRGVKDSVVEKYSDQAHFIYELIQNADDAGATKARFILKKDRLIFIHNGTRYFTITDPKREEEDEANGKLGDLNAITSIAQSSKPGESKISNTPATIGKFGIGFKAVFQYTNTPRICDKNISIDIERFIVPKWVDKDIEGRKDYETAFEFPFNHKERNAEESVEDIKFKLNNLKYPILFLRNLKKIDFTTLDGKGCYKEIIKEGKVFNSSIFCKEKIQTTVKLIEIIKKVNDKEEKEFLYLFSRETEVEKYVYSVGFFLNNDLKSIKSKEIDAFCFFTTKKHTNLKFIINAPFLLTDSREGIRAGKTHNINLIEKLSELAADSFIYLKEIGKEKKVSYINDNIFDIVPYDDSLFNDFDDKDEISFKPFYENIKKVFSNQKILPSSDRKFAKKDEAIWATVNNLVDLISNKQLSELFESSSKWVFVTKGRDNIQDRKLKEYIDAITQFCLDEDVLLKTINSEFIQKQSHKWLSGLYKYLLATENRVRKAKYMPIFLNQNNEAVCALKYNDSPNLFFPSPNKEDGYNYVNEMLLSDNNAKQLLERLGVKTPTLKDEIYNIILPLYEKDRIDENGLDLENDVYFLKFFEYYKTCSKEEKFYLINQLKNKYFINNFSVSDPIQHRGVPADLYYPSDNLKKFFESKPDTLFVDYSSYKKMIDEKDLDDLNEFFDKLGVNRLPREIPTKLDWFQANKMNINWASGKEHIFEEKKYDGFEEALNVIKIKKDKDLSIVIWNILVELLKQDRDIFKINHKYFYRRQKSESKDSSLGEELKSLIWLLNKNDTFFEKRTILKVNEYRTIYLENYYKDDLSEKYGINIDNYLNSEIYNLLSWLKIEINNRPIETYNINESEEFEEEEEQELEPELTEEQKECIELGQMAKALGLTKEEAETALKKAQEKKNRTITSGLNFTSNNNSNSDVDDIDDEIEKTISKGTIEIIKKTPKRTKVVENIINKIKDVDDTDNDDDNNIINNEQDTDEEDSDEYTPKLVDYSKRIKREEEKSANKIKEIEKLEDLQEKASKYPNYSYGWFKALLELEIINSAENNSNSREISISFAKVERDKGTPRTLILKHPNRYIPQTIEDLSDITLTLKLDDDSTVNAVIEVMNVKSYTLYTKIKDIEKIDIILNKVVEARIDAKNPVFLLEELKSQFIQLGYDDNYDMQKNLTENIDFIFGPPGTGKTTYLAEKVIIPFVRNNDNLKILVLAPTNKAADVLTSRIIEKMGNDNSYEDWLIRFGVTNDDKLESSPIYHDRNYDIRRNNKSVIITTIARFPYDYFMTDKERIHLQLFDWDYIVIDEASMIPLINIIYPLYKKKPDKFIIAGDPLQIEPITAIDLWKDENIYKLVGLNSFKNTQTQPHNYQVIRLTTQYRSIPVIGEVFSKFAYDGILNHYRANNNQRNLNIENIFKISALNIVKFPVSKYESIYKPKRLNKSSSYQIYSALFSFEFSLFLAKTISDANPNEEFKIGIIAPYRAQADIIDKLTISAKIPQNIDIQVGTIHGFQGDECDIIVSVFNTPPSITTSNSMFLNKKNIVNVSISRAKDYLFIVMPDDNTENVNNLELIKKLENLCKINNNYSEYNSNDIERLMFGNSKWLEENSFSTGHQNVNVYKLPEKHYEIRSEDKAIDIQIIDKK